MKTSFIRFIKSLTINRDYIFFGLQADFESQLNKIKWVRTNPTGKNEIKLFPFVSLGTLMFGGIGSLSINVLVRSSPIDEGTLKINFSTKIRPEHYFIAALFILFLIVFILKEGIGVGLFILGLWIIFHLWFQLVYRVQENHLIDKVVGKCRLRSC